MFVLSAACLSFAHAGDRSLTEFTAKENKKLKWSVVDDGVMGGLSKGKVSFTDQGTLKFAGDLSLKNNGGFSSLRTGDTKFNLSDYDGFVMRVKGDGRKYQLRIGTDARYRFMEVSFMAEFKTTSKWQEVRVPFSDLTGSFRGRTLDDKVFDSSKVRRIGLLIADKKEGEFNLEVDWIRAYSSEGAKSKNIAEIAIADGRFKTLVAALSAAGLVDAVSGDQPLTVFAPTDEAFAKLPKNTVKDLLKPENKEKLQAILKYHVVAGSNDVSDALKASSISTLQGEPVAVAFSKGRVQVNGATVLDGDIACSNGIIHVIDSVLLPPEPKPEVKNLATTAKAAGNFSTLLAAVEAAGLGSLLVGDAELTVFAPTDEAFAALPKGTVASLLKEENRDQLKAILAYHVVPGRVSAGDALNAKTAKSANGESLSFGFENGKLKVNKSNIVAVDIDAGNGVIHVIDTVLLPPAGEKQASQPDQPSAIERIEMAIDEGVPAFNRGNKEKCADLYEECLKSLAKDENVDGQVRKLASKVLKETADHDDANSKAWTYRRALDTVYEYLSE